MASLRLLAVSLSAVSLSACVVAPYPRQVYGQPVPAGYGQPAYEGDIAVVDVAPPPPYVEVVPALPFPGAISLGGYWGWG